MEQLCNTKGRASAKRQVRLVILVFFILQCHSFFRILLFLWRWNNRHVTSVGQRKNSESLIGFEPMTSQTVCRCSIHWGTENSWKARSYSPSTIMLEQFFGSSVFYSRQEWESWSFTRRRVHIHNNYSWSFQFRVLKFRWYCWSLQKREIQTSTSSLLHHFEQNAMTLLWYRFVHW